MFEVKIPERWQKIKLKYVAKLNPSRKKIFLPEDKLSYVPMECVKSGYLIPKEILFKDLISGLTYFEDGDIIFAKVTPCFENGNIAIAENLLRGAAYGSSELFVLRCFDVYKKFLFYFLQSSDFKNECIANMTGTAGLKRVPSKIVMNYKIPVPPLDEQEKIVRYLDKKTSDMTKFIDSKKKQVELLKELKRSIISDAVTNGIFGDKTPDTWTRKKLKYFATIKNGQDYKEFFDTKGKYPVMGSGGEFSRVTKFLYDKPSVLLGRKGTIDKPIYITEPFWTTDTMYYTVINSEIYPKFFYYLCCQIPFEYYKSGSVLPSMTQTDLYSIRLPSPPLWEQKEIADYLDVECAKIENLIEAIQKEISLVEELRKSLISEVVTGKIDVGELI